MGELRNIAPKGFCRGWNRAAVAVIALLAPPPAFGGSLQGPGQFFPSQGHCHIDESCPPRADSYEGFAYNSDPATSGPHEERFPTTFISESPLPKRILVHILEHGNVLILYNRNASAAQIEKLRNYAQRYDFRFWRLQQPLSPGADVGEQLEVAQAVFVAPYPAMSHTVALVAWTRLETLDDYDEDRINRFAKAWVGNAANARQ